MERRGLNFNTSKLEYKEQKEGKISFSSFFLHITKGEVKVAETQIRHYTRPANFYMPFFIFVEKEHRGTNVGADILENLNDFLIEREGVGILENAVNPEKNPEAVGMYERHGWKSLFPETDSDRKYGKYMYFSKDAITEQKLEELRGAIRLTAY